MNKERFTELLNLYLDDEISSSELSELMDETRRCPDRQKLFLDYCRIHKACSLMGDTFTTSQSRRSFKQVAYAVGGLAAAFALLGMAGRNLLPMLNGTSGNAVVVQSSPSEGSSIRFFPEIDADGNMKTRFFRVNEPPQAEYVGVSSFGRIQNDGNSNWDERLILNPSDRSFGLNAETLFSEEMLDLGALDLEDPFNAFDEIRGSSQMSFSKAAFSPENDVSSFSVARDSRRNLK